MSEYKLTLTENQKPKEIQSIHGKVAYFIPGSRRGVLTANNVFSLSDVTARHGEPRTVKFVPIPGVTLAKYFFTLTNGLNPEEQKIILSQFAEYTSGNGVLQRPSEDIPCNWDDLQDNLRKAGKQIGADVPTIDNIPTELQPDNYADAFSVWGGYAATYLLNRQGIQSTIIPEIPSVSADEIKYKVGEPKTAESLEDSFPEQLVKRTTDRISGLVNNDLLEGFLGDTNATWELAVERLGEVLSNALHAKDWRDHLDKLHFDWPTLEKPEQFFRSTLERVYEKLDLNPETDGWSVYGKIDSDSLTRQFTLYTLTELSEPAQLLRTLDVTSRPSTLTYSNTPNGSVRYYPGVQVMAHIFRKAKENNHPIIMQQLTDRKNTYNEAVQTSGIQPQQLQAVYAQPEETIPMRDHSLFTLLR